MRRKYLHINLNTRKVEEEVFAGEQIARAGRYFIAKTLLESGIAKIDPMAPENPLIFSAGPFAGSNWSNANRTSVGCKSPLTGGVKESNGGGTFSLALGHLSICGFTLHGAAEDWVIIHIKKDGTVEFDRAAAFMHKGNFETAALLHEKYGNKVSLGLCGPVGEYLGMLAGIAFSDTERRPSRLSARGAVGAVLGNKKVKAIVVDMDKMPAFHDRNKVITAIRAYGNRLQHDAMIENFRSNGTAGMADFTNHIGGLPVNNFSKGRLVDTEQEVLKMGGAFIREQNSTRGGEITHACMPGCLIQCSNVYADENGKEITSPVEYETLCLLGTNCGISDPDDLARLNNIANDLGVDSIETGATIAVLMEAGLGTFGDISFMHHVLDEIRRGTENGRLWARGTAYVGAHYQVQRVPVIKKQAISAYDPRVIEVTGISMQVTAQGADHTTGNVPAYDCHGKGVDELVDASIKTQIATAAVDSLGLCIFGRSVTNVSVDLITNAINDALGTRLDSEFLNSLGRDTLLYENRFNREAGFSVADDELPEFFYEEPLQPTNRAARFHGPELKVAVDSWWEKNSN